MPSLCVPRHLMEQKFLAKRNKITPSWNFPSYDNFCTKSVITGWSEISLKLAAINWFSKFGALVCVQMELIWNIFSLRKSSLFWGRGSFTGWPTLFYIIFREVPSLKGIVGIETVMSPPSTTYLNITTYG